MVEGRPALKEAIASGSFTREQLLRLSASLDQGSGHLLTTARVKGDLRGISEAMRLSNATIKNMRQNLGFAFLYNSLGIPIAAGVLYP